MQTQAPIPLETIAAITAALSVVLDQPAGSFVVRSIERAAGPAGAAPGAWAKAGLLESHLARRQFGLRNR